MGPYIINVDGLQLTKEESELINHELVGGVILFAKNYSNKDQITNLIQSIKDIKDNLIISVDHEGGRIQRFINNFTKLPSFHEISQIDDKDKKELVAYNVGYVAGHELSSIGINMNFSPVVDLSITGSSKLLDGRIFGSEVNQVIRLASCYIEGLKKTGVMPVLKHYPGHGRVTTDTHSQFCICDSSKEEIINQDILPFKILHDKYTIPIMTNHICYKNIDKNVCTYSSVLLKIILGEMIKIKPIIISDDLEMYSAKYFDNHLINYESRVLQALDAGCDYLIISTNLVKEDEYSTSANYYMDNYITENILTFYRENHDKMKLFSPISESRSDNEFYAKCKKDIENMKKAT